MSSPHYVLGPEPHLLLAWILSIWAREEIWLHVMGFKLHSTMIIYINTAATRMEVVSTQPLMLL